MARPAKFKTAEEMQAKIDEYFNSLFRPVLVWDKTEKENVVLTNPETGEPYMEQYKPATITGLALALDMNSRTTLINYAAKNKEFLNTITRAKLRVEEYAETRLYDRDGTRGAEFSLKCNFGWRDMPPPDENVAAIKDVKSVLVTIRKAAEQHGVD